MPYLGGHAVRDDDGHISHIVAVTILAHELAVAHLAQRVGRVGARHAHRVRHASDGVTQRRERLVRLQVELVLRLRRERHEADAHLVAKMFVIVSGTVGTDPGWVSEV